MIIPPYLKLALVTLILILGLWIFCLPILISRSTKNHPFISILNILWGMTGVVWVVSLIWALKERDWLPVILKKWAEGITQFIRARRIPLTLFLCTVIALIWDFKRYKKTKIFFDLNILFDPGRQIVGFLSFKWLPMSLQLAFALGFALCLIYKTRHQLNKNFWVLNTISLLFLVLALYFAKPDAATHITVYWVGIFLCTWAHADFCSDGNSGYKNEK